MKSQQNNAQTTKKAVQAVKKYKTLFDGTLGQWVGKPYKVELKEGVKPYHEHLYQVPYA